MIIQIDGWFAGGKSVLWSLLDGHKDIFVNPIHDFSHVALLNHKNNEEWVTKKHTTHLRKILAITEYYKFEKNFFEGKLGIGYSTNNVDYLPYSTNFYEFDKKFYISLEKSKKWDLEFIIETLYKSYYVVHTQKKDFPQYYATMSHPGHFKNYKNIPEVFPNMKSIVVKRGLKNIIATRTNRKERPKDLNEHQAFNTPFNVILQREEIEKILEYFDTNKKLQEQYPEQFLVVDFNDLVENTENTMKKVAKFLNIEYTTILSIPTRDGIVLEKDGMSFIGKENDDYKELLTNEEIEIIDKKEIAFKNRHNVTKKDFTNNFNLSKDINKIHQQLFDLKSKYNKIAIYGYGTFGELASYFLEEKTTCIVDRNYESFSSTKHIISNPKNIQNFDFDIVLITVLGRENLIINDLVNIYNIPENKIITLNI